MALWKHEAGHDYYHRSRIEQASFDWLSGLGWAVADGPDIAPETPNIERDYWGIAAGVGVGRGENKPFQRRCLSATSYLAKRFGVKINDTLNLISTIVLTDSPLGTSQGTGFYYSKLGPKDGEGPQWRTIENMWLVTNRHVVIPKKEDVEFAPVSFTFCLRKLGPSGALEWDPVVLSADDIEASAKFHTEKSVDVAAVNIYEAVTNRIKGSDQYAVPYLLNSDNFAGKNNIDVEASSDVLVAGFPKGFYDRVNLFPIIKSGIIASRWGVGFQGQPYFLIDAKLFPGSSGSVVISKPVDLIVKDGKVMLATEKQFAFLGIFSGEPTFQEAPVTVGDLTITQKSGFDLGIVWYAELVEEIIDKGIPLSQALTI